MRNSKLVNLGDMQCRVSEVDMRTYERVIDYLNDGRRFQDLAALAKLADPGFRELASGLLAFETDGQPLAFSSAWPLLSGSDVAAITDAAEELNARFIETLKKTLKATGMGIDVWGIVMNAMQPESKTGANSGAASPP